MLMKCPPSLWNSCPFGKECVEFHDHSICAQASYRVALWIPVNSVTDSQGQICDTWALQAGFHSAAPFPRNVAWRVQQMLGFYCKCMWFLSIILLYGNYITLNLFRQYTGFQSLRFSWSWDTLWGLWVLHIKKKKICNYLYMLFIYTVNMLHIICIYFSLLMFIHDVLTLYDVLYTFHRLHILCI